MLQSFLSYLKQRLTPLLLVFSCSLVLLIGSFPILLPQGAADGADDLIATETIPAFQQDDPFICLIPDDDSMLPCHANLLADAIPIQRSAVSSITNVTCENGDAAGYLCNNIDLLSFLPLATFGDAMASDLWGWTDPETGQEIVILTLRNQTAFVDISDPLNPIVLGLLPLPAGALVSAWRDVKTYGNHAYIVGDLASDYGMQIFDMTRLRGITQTVVLTVDAHYTGVSSTHNIVINEDSGLAALVGVSKGADRCGGGMHLVDLAADPLAPDFVGCVAEDGYVHDAQCVLYHGPDQQYKGQEICFNFNTNSIAIVDVTDRGNPLQLSRTTYDQSAYTHQGWVTPDQSFLLVDDESDETYYGINTTTLIYDISSLQAPKLIGVYTADTAAIDHNQYIHLGYSYQANYRAGFRLIDTAGISEGRLEEAAYFDIFPSSDAASFNGAWSVYPYFESGVVPISGVEQGLFLVKPTAIEQYRAAIDLPADISVQLGELFEHQFVARTLGQSDTYTVTVEASGVGATIQGATVVTGSAESPLVIPVEISVPNTLSVGAYAVEIQLASHQRPGTVFTQTLKLEAEIESDYRFELGSLSDSFVSNNQLVHHFALTNRSNGADQFEIEVESTEPLWEFSPTITQTEQLSVQESAKFSVIADLGIEGIYAAYTVTARSIMDPAVVHTVGFTKSLDVGYDSQVDRYRSGLPGETFTYTLHVTNRGEAQNRFTLSIDDSVWDSQVTIPETAVLQPDESAVLQVITTIGEGERDVLVMRIDSSRVKPHGFKYFYTNTNLQFAPMIAR